jgi:redox-sensitive bicupin YhaK (pirin superfamily)
MLQLPNPQVMERVAGFKVRRILANAPAVGPFVLFDHYGPVDFAAGQGLDIGPHPHIGMGTLTYLFEGSMRTRDSLGNDMTLLPGGGIWMVAGRGAAHSERTPQETRQQASRLCGAQLWMTLPEAHEEDAPLVEHHKPAALPVIEEDHVRLRVIAGAFAGVRSPVGVLSPTLCVHAELAKGGRVALNGAEHEERGVYLISGDAEIAGTSLTPERMVMLAPGEDCVLIARSATQVMLLGGAPLGPRHMWKTALARTPERLEQAKSDWIEGRIPSVVGEAERGNFPG